MTLRTEKNDGLAHDDDPGLRLILKTTLSEVADLRSTALKHNF